MGVNRAGGGRESGWWELSTAVAVRIRWPACCRSFQLSSAKSSQRTIEDALPQTHDGPRALLQNAGGGTGTRTPEMPARGTDGLHRHRGAGRRGRVRSLRHHRPLHSRPPSGADGRRKPGATGNNRSPPLTSVTVPTLRERARRLGAAGGSKHPSSRSRPASQDQSAAAVTFNVYPRCTSVGTSPS